MQNTLIKGRVQTLIEQLTLNPELKEDSNIVSLTSNELADLLLKVTGSIKQESQIDNALRTVVNLLGEYGIAERVLLFQVYGDNSKAILSHYWESSYISKYDPIGYEFNLKDIPLFKFFKSNNKNTFQIENLPQYLLLPNYIFKNKLKSLFIKLKTKSLLVNVGTFDKTSLILNLQFVSRPVIWSNEIEKALQSIVDQLAIATEQFSERRKKESLQKNIQELKEEAIKEKEDMFRQFASDLHDLPCSIIPSLRTSIRQNDFSQAETLLEELNNNLRQLINEYVIPDISLLGLNTTIYQFINGFKKGFSGKILLDLPDDEIILSQKQSVEVFKVIKEWFCNISKHSEATEVSFKMRKLNNCFLLINISDNGKGFDVNNIKSFGYGIPNIKRRLNDIGASFEIVSESDKGTSIKLKLSLE